MPFATATTMSGIWEMTVFNLPNWDDQASTWTPSRWRFQLSSLVLSTEHPALHTKRYLASIVHDGREGDAGSTPLVLNPSVKTPCAGDKGLRTEYGATSLALMKQ
jgi:hypothetical protein